MLEQFSASFSMMVPSMLPTPTLGSTREIPCHADSTIPTSNAPLAGTSAAPSTATPSSNSSPTSKSKKPGTSRRRSLNNYISPKSTTTHGKEKRRFSLFSSSKTDQPILDENDDDDSDESSCCETAALSCSTSNTADAMNNASFSTPARNYSYLSNHIVVNQERSKRGIPTLTRCSILDNMAREKAHAMAQAGSLLQPYQQPTMVENVQRGPSLTIIHQLIMFGMTDRDRNNILNPNFVRFGMGTARSPVDGQIYMSQLFQGKPKVVTTTTSSRPAIGRKAMSEHIMATSTLVSLWDDASLLTMLEQQQQQQSQVQRQGESQPEQPRITTESLHTSINNDLEIVLDLPPREAIRDKDTNVDLHLLFEESVFIEVEDLDFLVERDSHSFDDCDKSIEC